MLLFTTDKNYKVFLEEDGDDLWITVTNGYCKSYDCIVGGIEDAGDIKRCVDVAYGNFYPAQYVSELLESNDDRQRVLYLARDAYEIDRALELAISA